MQTLKKLASLLLMVFSFLSSVKSDKPRWLTSLDNSRTLNTLAFIGTHESASSNWFAHKTQRMSISEQLEAGIRVLDIRVRRSDNLFKIQQEIYYLDKMFTDVINDLKAFLVRNPGEFVMMIMLEEFEAESSTKSNCQILEDYLQKWPNLFAPSWSFRDTLGQLRGKILLAQRDNSGFSGCSSVVYPPCKEQRDLELAFFYPREKKWEKIRALQGEVSAKDHYHHCFINYLSASSYWNSWESVANTYENIMLLTYNEGMNNKFLSEFKNPQNTLYIVMADFPFEELINLIVDSNS